jgi:protein translocase SecG subunit
MTVIHSLLPYIQITLSVLLVVAILLQNSEASAGGAFGGGDNFGGATHTRRGFERVIFIATIIIAVLFVLSAVLALVK